MRLSGVLMAGCLLLAGQAHALARLGTVSMTTISVTSVSATGNISAAKFVGDGSLLSNVPAVATTSASTFTTTGATNGFVAYDRAGANNSVLYRSGNITNLYDNTAGNVITYNSSGAVGIAQNPGTYKLTVAGDVYANGGWLRSAGNTGFYNETYGGGWYMADSTYLRVYGSKQLYSNVVIRADGGFNVGGNQGTGWSGVLPCGDTIYFTGGILYYVAPGAGCNGDIAEHYGTEEEVTRGDIVMLGTTTTSRDFRVSVPAPGETSKTTYTITTANVRKATAEGRGRILGAVPTAPFLFSKDKIDPKDKPQEVALVGHVPVKMTLEGGPIAIGDPITVAEKSPGKGRKATSSGRILGYALENYTKESDSKDGMIEVFIHLEEWENPADKQAVMEAIENLRNEFEAYRKAHP